MLMAIVNVMNQLFLFISITQCQPANMDVINSGQTTENNRPSKHRRARYINGTGKVLTII